MTSALSIDSAPSRRRTAEARAALALSAAARFWFVATVVGQLVFAAYIVLLYGGAAAGGDWNGWNKVMSHGFVRADLAGNIVTAAHLLLAAVIMVGGTLQLIPQLRARAPSFHRWNGRVYLAGAVVAALSGLYMLWFRGAVGDTVQHLGTSLNAVLVVACAAMTVRRALARDFSAHRRWALRLFLCVSGVWFFRVGLMFWLAVNGGPAGFDIDTFTGPFLSFLSFAQYLLPLAVLELYLRCGGVAARCATALLLAVLTVAMALGIAVATMGMWWPRM
ncbi:Predicted membrane protein [Duganella sp. CF517]|uniref:DUF2306 domain-containing protein n=1 Tax=Duganella sp. CF517 TaxID=1881038 RepID=UPI0008D6DB67|nr:DUF2306 domain-containing protein [Duganella sp. CF517]SEN29164.1 Predicted membrane protein [Duganella sp. CF517]